MKLPALLIAAALFAGCASHQVTLSSDRGEVYGGHLKFQGGYTGTLTFPRGPGGERFSGRYVCVDKTATGALFGTAPSSFVAGSSSGQVNAIGQWTGIGSGGSTMVAELVVGRGGHGIGEAKHGNGQKYRIAF